MDIKERLRQLGLEMRQLIEKNFGKPAKENEVVYKRLAAIRDEIHSYGCTVTWQIIIDPERPEKPSAEVTVWEPKTNMSPDEQKLYDQWFRTVNKIDKEG